MAETLTYRVADFEGPLDLILTLIAKHKLNIYDIEISVLVEQYMAAIREMQETAELTSEFLEMAAQLVLIKSRELLPRHEEADELKQELTGQLLEYQICKNMAAKLAERNISGLLFVREPQEVEVDQTYRRSHATEELLSAYFGLVGKSARRLPPPKEVFAPLVERRIVSVRSRIVLILNDLYRTGRQTLEKVYQAAEDRSELVATFLALLELMKDSRIKLDEKNEITLTDASTAREDLLAVYATEKASADEADEAKEERAEE